MDISEIVDYENGDQDEDETVQMFQSMINDGSVWGLQEYYGRTAMGFLESGKCILGEISSQDYWGNYIPSRYEVEPGTKGSLEYQQKRQKED
jgi:hypothetical protein